MQNSLLSRQDNLLDNLSTEEAATKLSAILARLVFEPTLVNDLVQLKTRLESGNLSAQDYFDNETVKNAIEVISQNNQHFLPSALRSWWQQPHTFSSYEKIFL